jgi:NADH-ubiquinone oxidoreductase chain 5
MYISIVLLPLIGAVVSGFFGFYLGRRGSSVFSTTTTFLSLLLSLHAFYQVGILGQTHHISMFSWIQRDYLDISWGFLFDPITVVMLIVVTYVSTLVHLYATNYMGDDPHLSRFMSYLSFFTFFMLILVTGDNFMQLFTGWEGVGVSSYLLINFWYTRIQANKSAIKAMLVNRVGDFGLALAIAYIFYCFNSVSYEYVFSTTSLIQEHLERYQIFGLEFTKLDLIGVGLLVGAMGKSAQLGLHTWLPDAMEGPTPVSALIHAATMVTAGVFLLVRCSPTLEFMNSWVAFLITFIGMCTAFFAATTGLVQNDMKRVIAYSTCSQLGYMIFACGVSNYSGAMFHLTNHAFFKALLFLGAGAIIHAIGGEQDLRKMGGFSRSAPYVYSAMLLGSLALTGFPYLSGFYSKDIILEVSMASYFVDASLSYTLGILAAACTAFYSFRLAHMAFSGRPSGFRFYYSDFHGTPTVMIFVLTCLAVGSIFSGFMLYELFIGPGSDFWSNSIYLYQNNGLVSHSLMSRPVGSIEITPEVLKHSKGFIRAEILEALYSRPVFVSYEYISLFFKLVPLIFGITGSILAVLFIELGSRLYLLGRSQFLGLISLAPGMARNFVNFLGEKWYFDKIYKKFVADNFLFFGYHVSLNTFDRGIIEVLGPYGIGTYVPYSSKSLNRVNDSHLNNYVSSILLGILVSMFVTVFLSIMIFYFPLDFVFFAIGLTTSFIIFKNN